MSKNTPDLPISETPTPTAHRGKSRQRRIKRSNAGTTRDALGPLEPGCELFALTNGQFSLIDVLEHCLAYTGPAQLDIATWTAADGDLRRAQSFLLDGRVQRVRFLVDPSFRTRKPDFCASLIELFGNDAIRTVPLHGKFSIIRNDRWNLAIRSSMNLNPNARIESVEISDDAALADFLTGVVDEIHERSPDANFASQSRSQIERHDSASGFRAPAGALPFSSRKKS